MAGEGQAEKGGDIGLLAKKKKFEGATDRTVKNQMGGL